MEEEDDNHQYLTMLKVENGTHQYILRRESYLPVAGKTPFADQETEEVKQRIIDWKVKMQLEMKKMTKKVTEKAITWKKMNVLPPFVIHRTIVQVLENHQNLSEAENIDNSLSTYQKRFETEEIVVVVAVFAVVQGNNGLPEKQKMLKYSPEKLVLLHLLEHFQGS